MIQPKVFKAKFLLMVFIGFVSPSNFTLYKCFTLENYNN